MESGSKYGLDLHAAKVDGGGAQSTEWEGGVWGSVSARVYYYNTEDKDKTETRLMSHGVVGVQLD